MTRAGLSAIGVLALPPMLRKNALHIRNATLRGHPLLGVEAVLIVGLLGVVYRYLAWQCGDQRRQSWPVQKGTRRTGDQECGGGHAGRKGAQVIVGQGMAHGLGMGWEHAEVVVDLF